MDEAVERLTADDNVVVHLTSVRGKGIFAPTGIKRGERIAYFEGHNVRSNTRYSLFVKATGERIEPTGRLRYLNHSCKPNAHFRGRWLFASGEIIEEDEITIDYLDTEQAISAAFICTCGAENCRGRIDVPNQTRDTRSLCQSTERRNNVQTKSTVYCTALPSN